MKAIPEVSFLELDAGKTLLRATIHYGDRVYNCVPEKEGTTQIERSLALDGRSELAVIQGILDRIECDRMATERLSRKIELLRQQVHSLRSRKMSCGYP